MESNSPGRSPRDDKREAARRERSRSRTRTGLTTKVNFFEFGAQIRDNSLSLSSTERTSESHETTVLVDLPAVEDSVFDQSEVDALEREIMERRHRLSRRDDDERQRRPAVALRRVVSPVRVEVASPSQQFATEVYISSWTERVRSPDPVQASPPTPPPRQDVQPPWRLARRSEPATPAPHTSPFQSPTTPASALSKYQEWRARRLTSVESPEQIAPWRKQQIQRRTSKESGPESPPSRDGRRHVEIESQPSNVRKGSQPQWYSEFRTASFTQTASRMDAFRVGGVKTHYDFHIAEIKGEIGLKTGREMGGKQLLMPSSSMFD